ncbi:helix-turn-helix domain-containing protein [Candidatus Uhrbacteria bacterium]|nr:helix-turn-helix domain-containing protein [Candidatus Uhrbacteria bacterium]
MYVHELQHAGLTEKQAKIYLAALELGMAKAPEIAKQAGLKRTTAYGIVDELVHKGLLSTQKKGSRMLFRAQDPLTLLGLVDQGRRAVAQVVPQLAAVYASSNVRPRLEFFEGREGIKRIYEDTLQCRSKKILQIVKVEDFKEFPGGDFSQEYIRRRAEKGIIAFALHPASGDTYDQTYGQESAQWKRHVRYLPPSLFCASMIMIYDHKVMMISTKAENFGFIIESQAFASTMRSMFEFLWKLGSATAQE